jgi:ferritin-like metal-binding protein YciE
LIAFEDHLTVTEEQVTRLEQVFESIGEKAKGKKCDVASAPLHTGHFQMGFNRHILTRAIFDRLRST